jgi:hypothetical protein
LGSSNLNVIKILLSAAQRNYRVVTVEQLSLSRIL